MLVVPALPKLKVGFGSSAGFDAVLADAEEPNENPDADVCGFEVPPKLNADGPSFAGFESVDWLREGDITPRVGVEGPGEGEALVDAPGAKLKVDLGCSAGCGAVNVADEPKEKDEAAPAWLADGS